MAGLSDPKEDPPLSPREALYLILWCSAISKKLCSEELRDRKFASKTADLKQRDELRTPMCPSKTTDLKERDELRIRILRQK